jgi:RNA polymerase sigma-70 factor (sigma-E family)
MAAMAIPATGQQAWLEKLYRAHHDGLVRLARVLTGDDAVAAELAQEAFLRAHRALVRPKAGAELAYLRRTVINLAHSHHRHLRVVRSTPVDGTPDMASAEAGAARRARRQAVVAAMRALPERQRDCVVLHYYEELSDVEIARTLGISVGSVKTHLHRARAALATMLEDER